MLLLLFLLSNHLSGVRTIQASPCDIVDVKLSVGQSTLLQFDEEPTLTFHADDQHFLLKNHESAKRSLAIIPVIRDQDIQRIFGDTSSQRVPVGKAFSESLDRHYRTNLFVFLKSSSRLMFRLRLVEKSESDFVVRIKQVYRKGCGL